MGFGAISTRIVRISAVVVADGLTGFDGRRIDPAVLDGKAVLVVNAASECASMLAFVEDSEERWFKLPALRDGDVELVGRDDGVG
jgi:hypothetical protein